MKLCLLLVILGLSAPFAGLSARAAGDEGIFNPENLAGSLTALAEAIEAEERRLDVSEDYLRAYDAQTQGLLIGPFRWASEKFGGAVKLRQQLVTHLSAARTRLDALRTRVREQSWTRASGYDARNAAALAEIEPELARARADAAQVVELRIRFGNALDQGATRATGAVCVTAGAAVIVASGGALTPAVVKAGAALGPALAMSGGIFAVGTGGAILVNARTNQEKIPAPPRPQAPPLEIEVEAAPVAEAARAEGEPEFTLDEDSSQGLPGTKVRIDSKKDDARKEAADEKEKRALLETLRKDFDGKARAAEEKFAQRRKERLAPPPKREVNGSSEAQKKLNAAMRAAADHAAEDLKQGTYRLRPELAKLGKLKLLSEVEDLVMPEAEKARERDRMSQAWDKTVEQYKEYYRSLPGSFDERINQLLIRSNLEHTSNYLAPDEDPTSMFMSRCFQPGGYCSCLGNSMFSMGLVLAVLEGEEIPARKQFLFNDLGYHAAAVMYDTVDKSAWDFMKRGAPTRDLAGIYYHPAEIANAELTRKGAEHIPAERLEVFRGRMKNSEAEKREIAKRGTENGQGKFFATGLPRNVPLQGARMTRDKNGSTRTERNIGSLEPLTSGAEVAKTPISRVRVDWNGAQQKMRGLVANPAFRELIEILRNPTLIATRGYDKRKLRDLQSIREQIDSVLLGGASVTHEMTGEGTTALGKFLAAQNPEIGELYQALEASKEDFSIGREKTQFDLFSVLGPEAWAGYEQLARSYAGDSNLSKAVGQPDITLIQTDVEYLNKFFSDPDNVAFDATYRRGSAAKDTSPKNQGHEKASRTAGMGNDASGLRLPPEKTGQVRLKPRTFAEFIFKSTQVPRDPGSWANFTLPFHRWTPALTAALRAQGQYSKTLVEWLAGWGYRALGSSRAADTHKISGPDNIRLPKDVAALVVDILQGKDGTGANIRDLRSDVIRNYGSVDAYLARVKAEFEAGPQPAASPSATPPAAAADTGLLDVFKDVALSRNVDKAVLDRADKRSFQFAKIPPTAFVMGALKSAPDVSPDERRAVPFQGPVRITREYSIQLTPVTQAQWAIVMGTGPQTLVAGESVDRAGGILVNRDHPVTLVTMTSIRTFLSLLSRQDGRCTYRLPTEAEWELAATSSPQSPDSEAWHQGNSGGTTHAVGLKQANRYGLYDMYGNVRQLTQDWYAPYDPNVSADPKGPASGTFHVARGGGMSATPDELKSYDRSWRATPHDRHESMGFRMVRECP